MLLLLREIPAGCREGAQTMFKFQPQLCLTPLLSTAAQQSPYHCYLSPLPIPSSFRSGVIVCSVVLEVHTGIFLPFLILLFCLHVTDFYCHFCLFCVVAFVQLSLVPLSEIFHCYYATFSQKKTLDTSSAFGDGDRFPTGITGTNHRWTIFAANLEPDKIDQNKLFNLFSLYGNIIRIQILRRKPDQALIEMADGFQAELAIYFLKGAMLFGKPLNVTYSNFEHVRPSPETHEFAGSNLNRFNSNTVKNYSHCCAPTKMMIHVFSLPRDITQDKVLAYLEGFGAIVKSKLFQANEKKQAFIMFENKA